MRRGVRFALGIPAVLIGFFVALGGGAALVAFGLDGTYTLTSGVHSSGHALVFDGLALRGLREAGAWRAVLQVDVDLSEGGPAFVGIGPRTDVEAYLADAVVDRVTQLRPVGGLKTERVEGPPTRRDPGPPAGQAWWVAEGTGSPAGLEWTARAGDWSVVVMRADGRQRLDGTGSLSLTVPAIGPAAVVALVIGVLLMAGGGALVVSAAKMTGTRAAPPPDRPDAP